MKQDLLYYVEGGRKLDSLISAFEEFEKELTWFQTDMDNGEFQYEEAKEAVEENYFTIRNLANKISEELKNAEDNLIQADNDYEEWIEADEEYASSGDIIQ